MFDYAVAVDAPLELDLDNLTKEATANLSKALNTTVRRYRTAISRRIRDEVNLKAGDLVKGSNGGDLQIDRFASTADLEAAIVGRQRPYSLARFARGAKTHGKVNPKVQVAPGVTKEVKGGFLMNLASGNVGLAIRLKAGERLKNKHTMVKVSRGLYLLYGPSVDQVFRSVREDVRDEAADFLRNEFARLQGL